MRLYVPLTFGAASLAVLASAQTASLTAGQTVAVPNFAYGRSVIASKTSPFTGKDNFGNTVFSGTLTSYVTPHPGGSTLDFLYYLTSDAKSVDGIEKLTLPGFASYTTGVGQSDFGAPGGGGTLATNATRQGSGVVSFNFVSGNGGSGFLMPGTFSSALLIETNATAYADGSASIIDGGTGNAATFMPVPEPSAFAALGLGALGLVRRRVRKP